MNSGDSPPTATRVKGTVKENAITPRSPHVNPVLAEGSTGDDRWRVALLWWLMYDDISSRIAAALRDWIAAAPAGARLPSTRALVSEHRASPVTVQRALRDLSSAGLVETRPGVGTFVRTVRTARPADYGWQTGALGSPEARIQGVSTAMRTARCAASRKSRAKRPSRRSPSSLQVG